MPDLDKFVADVDALLQKRASISLEDAGVERNDPMLVNACHDGTTANDFVTWFIQKYDLEESW